MDFSFNFAVNTGLTRFLFWCCIWVGWSLTLGVTFWRVMALTAACENTYLVRVRELLGKHTKLIFSTKHLVELFSFIVFVEQ